MNSNITIIKMDSNTNLTNKMDKELDEIAIKLGRMLIARIQLVENQLDVEIDKETFIDTHTTCKMKCRKCQNEFEVIPYFYSQNKYKCCDDGKKYTKRNAPKTVEQKKQEQLDKKNAREQERAINNKQLLLDFLSKELSDYKLENPDINGIPTILCKFNLICPKNHTFETTMSNVIHRKRKCGQCGGTKKMNINQIEEKLREMYPDCEMLSDQTYENCNSVIQVKCLNCNVIVSKTYKTIKTQYGRGQKTIHKC